jgi:hypothetical protein
VCSESLWRQLQHHPIPPSDSTSGRNQRQDFVTLVAAVSLLRLEILSRLLATLTGLFWVGFCCHFLLCWKRLLAATTIRHDISRNNHYQRHSNRKEIAIVPAGTLRQVF